MKTKMPRGNNYRDETEMAKAIKEKQQKYETSSMSNQDEKALLREIDQMKKALPDMKELSIIEPQLQKIREQKKEISSALDNVNRVINAKEDKIKPAKEALQNQRERRDQVREEAEKFTEIIEKNNEEIQNTFKKKDELREAYYKAQYEFELQNDKNRWIRGLHRQQKDLARSAEDKSARIAQKRAELENRANPYDKEIETCDQLIKYCNKLKGQAGLLPESSEEVAKKTEQSLIAEYNRQDIEQKLKDGKISAQHKKDDGVVQVGGGKGKKGKKSRKEKGNETAAAGLSIDFAVIGKFGKVGVSPPVAVDDLDHKISELEAKAVKYQKDGEAQMSKERNALEEDIERLVDQDLEAERKAAEEEEYGEEEESKEADRSGQRARGDRGFGGESRQKDRKGGEWGEFEGSDDEYVAPSDSAYSKPSRGGGQQINAGRKGRGGKTTLALDEDNFPTL